MQDLEDQLDNLRSYFLGSVRDHHGMCLRGEIDATVANRLHDHTKELKKGHEDRWEAHVRESQEKLMGLHEEHKSVRNAMEREHGEMVNG